MNRVYSWAITLVLALLAMGALVMMLIGAGYALLASSAQNRNGNALAEVGVVYGLLIAGASGIVLLGSLLALRWRSRNGLGPRLGLRRLPGPDDWP